MPGIKRMKKLVGISSRVGDDRAKGKSHREFKLFLNDPVTRVDMINSTVTTVGRLHRENFAEVCAPPGLPQTPTEAQKATTML